MRPQLNSGTLGRPVGDMGLFTDDEIWTGGFYELALEYPDGTDEHLIRGLIALWRSQNIAGCYLHRDREPDEQPRLEFEPSLLAVGHLHGVSTLPGGVQVACGTCLVPDDDGSDWLVFYLPMSALGTAFPVGGFPFDHADHAQWRAVIDAWLGDLGRNIFLHAPYRLGLVGFETSGDLRAADLARSGVPQTRYMGLLVPNGDVVEWLPRTEAG